MKAEPVHSRDLAEEARELDLALERWARSVPGGWRYKTAPVPVESLTQDDGGIYPMHIYPSHGHAAVWTRYRAVRLTTNSIRKRALSLLHDLQGCPLQSEPVPRQLDFCQKTINNLAVEFCSGVQSLFTAPGRSTSTAPEVRSIEINGNLVFTKAEILPKMAALVAWPMTVASCIPSIPDAEREWLNPRLRSIANALGDAVLIDVIEKGEFEF